MAKLSLIVPAYNVQKYLAMCLQSLRAQSYADIEIICVDDGSDDLTATILELAAAVEPRLHVVRQDNSGGSVARNKGLSLATGEYVLFVDSDDFLELNACERILAAFSETDADIVTFGAHVYPWQPGNPWPSDLVSPRDITYTAFSPDILFKERSWPFVWRSAFRLEFLRSHGFTWADDLPLGEDTVLHFLTYPAASVTSFISDKLYYYRIARGGSLMESYDADKHTKYQEHLRIADRVYENWQAAQLPPEQHVLIIKWLFDFLIKDFEEEPDPNRTQLYLGLRELLIRRVKPEDLDNPALNAPTREVYARIMAFSPSATAGLSLGKTLLVRFKGEQHGAAHALRAVLRRLGSELRRLLEPVVARLPLSRRRLRFELWQQAYELREEWRPQEALNALQVEYIQHQLSC